MHKKLYKIIITIITLFLLSVFLFAFINILSMKANIQREIDAYSEMFKAQGDKPEQIATTLNAVRIGREKEIGSSTIQLVSIIILAITAGILLWYSYETKRLADLTAKQIKIKLRPIIVVESISSNEVKIKNIGESSALSVKIQPIPERKCQGSQSGVTSNNSYDIHFDECPVLEQGVGATIIGFFKLHETSGFVNPNPDPFLNFHNQFFVGSYYLTIHFNDIERGSWETKILVDKLGIHFQGIYEKTA